MNENLKILILQLADDHLILGHRNSEWTGLGPIMEEDIAFSSMSQDKIGHALSFYELLNEQLGMSDADTLAFKRIEQQFTCCHFVELPNGEYDFSLMRHFLFDHACNIRFEMLALSSFEPLAMACKKMRSEVKYHIMHANTWLKQLTIKGTEESKIRMQTALNECFGYALGMFETNCDEKSIIQQGIYEGEEAVKTQWLDAITAILSTCQLTLPTGIEAVLGGRKGYHTIHLQPLLTEMTEVIDFDKTAKEW